MTTRELLIKINGDNSGLNNALIKSGEDLKAFEKNAKAVSDVFTSFGKKMTTAVTLPIAALGTAMVYAASESEKATAMLAASIKAVGNEGIVSAQAMADYADELMRTTKYDDEATLGAIRMLESLTGLNEKGLKEIIPSIQDFASAWGMDLEQAASLVGKTIASGTNALGRYGIEVDSAAPKTEKFAQIMQGLARYQGTAAAEGKTFSGQLSILKNEAENLAEEFGRELLPIISDIVKGLRDLVSRFSDLPAGTKRAILAGMAFAASIGPISLAIGGVIKAINMFKGIMLLAGGPAGWITLAAVAVVALGVAMGTVIKKNVELQKIYSGKSEAPVANQLAMIEEQAKLTNKEFDDFIAKTKDLTTVQKDRGKELDRLNKLSLYGGEEGIKKEKQRLEHVKEIQKATIEELKKKVDAEKAAQDEASGLGEGVKDLTEAEEEYAKAMDIATSAIEKNMTEEERLGRQFDILQNLKTTSSKDEENRLKALAIIRQQIFDIQMKEMEDLAAANADNGSTLEDGIESNHEYSDSLKQMIEDVKSLDEEQADAKKKTEEFRKKVQEISATVVSFIGPLVELGAALGGDAEDLAAFGAIATDAINGIAAAISGNIIGAVIAAIGLITKLINLFKKKSEAAREAKRSTESYMDTVTSGEGKLIRFVNIIGGAFQSIIGNFTLSFDKASLEALRTLTAFKELAASYGDSIGKTLGDAMIKGMSKVNFMAEIGKILINAMIAAALATGPIAAAMAAIGEKIAYMVVNGFTDEGMAEVEQMASDLYDIFSTGVLPIVQKIRDIFGQDSASEETGSFASGVTNFRGGIARVGEQGPETVRLPRGSSVEPNGMGRSGGITMTFNSPRALSPMETKRAMLAAGRQLAFETGGNF